ncbi:MAG: POT family MFS transporter [Planctomycetaceae bacterium]|nr:POT family MFS transporter [Planctomycetaceae bacterium]
MERRPYLTAPQPLTTMPPGIPYIVGNEAAERFSFYGMKAILTIYMTQHLIGWNGQPATLSDEDAKSAVHLFVASAYFFPLLGAIVSDWLFGKYHTIIWLSIVYCIGHLLLAVVPGREGLMLGLTLIAIGAGGVKSCVSAHVGDQFGERNQHLLSKVFSWFYFSINFGAFLSTLLTPLLLTWYGPHVAFGVPGVLMGLATLVFWSGRHRFVHIPPGGTEFLRESFSGEGLQAILRLVPIYLFVAVFWSLYDQTASAWVLQAEHMDRNWMGIAWESSQIQAANPIIVMALIPLFAYVIYPLLGRVLPPSPLWRIAIGFFITAAAFTQSALIETWIDEGGTPNIFWQLVAYVILTAAEVMVSITCLEFSYTQAPNRMKSLIMSFYMLSVSLGNLLVSVINQLIQNPDGTTKLPGASYYWFFTGLMFVASVGFLAVAATYRGKTYIQQEDAG